MDAVPEVVVEINAQQTQVVEKVRRRDYDAMTLPELVRHGFREWARTHGKQDL